MNLLLKLATSPWFWLDIALSVSGGVIVWWGLIIEKKAEELLPPENFKPDIFDDIVAKQKSELERGWRILMTGIVVEVVAALGVSILSSIEIAGLEDKMEMSRLESKQAAKEAASANERTSITESNNLVLRTNAAALESAVYRLAKQLDMSTNALAEAQKRINSLSEDVVANSPSNFPISSVFCSGYIVLNKDSAITVGKLLNKPALIFLIPQTPQGSSIPNWILSGGTAVRGWVTSVSTNRSGDPVVYVVFNESNLHTVGPGPLVTFNNLQLCRLDLCPNGSVRGTLHVEEGYLSLEINSSFEYRANFRFPEQTNEIIQIKGIRTEDLFR